MPQLYEAVNNMTGDRYVGVTNRTMDVRRRHHIASAKSGRKGCHKFWAALRKYGPHAFAWTVLQEFEDYDAALEAEKAEISSSKPSYNISRGGQFALRGVPRTREWNENISMGLKGRTLSEAQRQTMRGRKPERGIPVVCLNGDKRWFKSIMDASEHFGIGASQINNSCRGREVSAGGLFFAYASEVTDGEMDRRVERLRQAKAAKKHVRSVVCVNDGRIFATVTLAAEAYDICISRITQICTKGGRAANGLRFRYADGNERPLYPGRGPLANAKSIRCLDDGAIYQSAAEAARAYGMKSYRNIVTVAAGKRSKAGGRRFAYAEAA